MKKIIIFTTIIIFITVITIIFSRREASVAPVSPSAISSPTPSPTPKTFQFDSSTDLNKELDNVNPQVLDSDFNE